MLLKIDNFDEMTSSHHDGTLGFYTIIFMIYDEFLSVIEQSRCQCEETGVK
jgi:hypothetical protein